MTRDSGEVNHSDDRVLHILHVEDSPLDAELVAASLADGGLRCEICVVDTEKALRAQISTCQADLILADYSLPMFDGMSALRIAKQECVHVPFLFVSGAIGEEQAIETLKAGAVDYVLKQRLERLVPAVQRALRESDERYHRLLAEQALRKAHDELESRVAERTRELYRVNKSLRILSESNQALIRASDESQLLERICQIAVEFGGYAFAWVGLAVHDDAKSVRPLAWAGCDQALVESLQVTWEDTQRGRGPTGTAIRTGRACIMHNLAQEPHYQPWRNYAETLGLTSSISLPLSIDGQLFGAMSIYAKEPQAFDEAEVRLLLQLADDLSFGLSALRARTDRQKALDDLRISEQGYRRIVQTAEEGICVLDQTDTITFVNQKLADLLGYAPEELLGEPLLEFIHEWDRPVFEAALFRRRSGAKGSHDARFHRKDGQPFWGIVAGAPIFDEAGQHVGALKMITDITERKKLEGDVAEISSLEQQRIGRDLHDVLGQNLTGISFLGKILEQKLGQLNMPESADAAEICRLATLTNRQARSLARGLAPLGLTAANFENKLKELAAGVQDIFSVSCAFQYDPHVRIPNDEAALHLFRITQEAINNAVRHGKSRNIMIQCMRQNGQTLLMIQDDGTGLPKEMQNRQGMGLQIMNFRAGAIGGHLKVRSQEPGGTVVICSFGHSDT